MIIHSEDAHPLISAICRDIHDRRMNKLLAIVGGTQKGKSRLSIAFGHNIDENFSIKRNIAIIDPLEFMELLERKPRMPRGSVPIFDDAGVGINAQDWHDFQVQKLSRVMHIVGNAGYCMIISTPDYSFINSQVRRVVTDKIVVKKIDWKRKNIRFKYFCDVHYDDTGKEYKSYPVKIYKNGKRRKIKMFTLAMPPEELLKEFYELESQHKFEFREESLKEVKKDQMAREELKKTKAEVIAEKVKKIVENPASYILEYKTRKYVDQAKIEYEFNVGGRIAQRIKKQAEEILGIGQFEHQDPELKEKEKKVVQPQDPGREAA
jgi:hypothetical protein